MIYRVLLACLLFPATLLVGGEREQVYLERRMIPLAREFLRRNCLPCDTNFGVEKVARPRVEFLTNRPAPFVTSSMRIGKQYTFKFFDDDGVMEVWSFLDATVETYYDLSEASKEKVEAVRALNSRNKLNDELGLALALKFFRLQGHKEENFHPIKFRQMSWANKGQPDYVPLPFYEAQWYRKDVTKADREQGVACLPSVSIYVSGITSNLVWYSKVFMPVGADFQSPRHDKHR